MCNDIRRQMLNTQGMDTRSAIMSQLNTGLNMQNAYHAEENIAKSVRHGRVYVRIEIDDDVAGEYHCTYGKGYAIPNVDDDPVDKASRAMGDTVASAVKNCSEWMAKNMKQNENPESAREGLRWETI